MTSLTWCEYPFSDKQTLTIHTNKTIENDNRFSQEKNWSELPAAWDGSVVVEMVGPWQVSSPFPSSIPSPTSVAGRLHTYRTDCVQLCDERSSQTHWTNLDRREWAEHNRYKSVVLRTFFAFTLLHSSTDDSRLLCFARYGLRSDISDSSAAHVQILSSTRWL